MKATGASRIDPPTLDPTNSLALKKQADVLHRSIYACFVLCAVHDVNDKDGNDGDVEALSAALTDSGCLATL